MEYPTIEEGGQLVCASCKREVGLVKAKDHIMGCSVRSRRDAIAHFEYEQSLKRVQNLLTLDLDQQ